MLSKEDIKYIYPLSPMQEGMFFHHLLDGSSSVYFEQISYRVSGQLDIEIVEKSLNEIMKRYDILRTVFVKKSDRLLQVVLKERKVDFYHDDFSKSKDKEEQLLRFKEDDRRNVFDLTKDVLMRVAVIRLDKNEYEFVWSHHHILMDGWCLGILIADFFEIYNSYLQNREYRLPPVIQYRAYIDWLEKQDTGASGKYWEKYIEDYGKTVSFPKTCAQGRNTGYKDEELSTILDKIDTARVNDFAKERRVTLSALIQTVWGILFSKYNFTRDVVFGAVVSGRPPDIEHVETIVGLFINTIPVRVKYEKSTTFKELLLQVMKDGIESELHHYFPLVKTLAKTPLKHNLLDHFLAFENFPISIQAEDLEKKGGDNAGNGLNLKLTKAETYARTNFDFNAAIIPRDQLVLGIKYNGNVYAKEIIEQIAAHFKWILRQVIAHEELEIDAVSLLTGEEKSRILCEFNCPGSGKTLREKTLDRLFAGQVEKKPDHTVLIGQLPHSQFPIPKTFNGIHLTYKELNEKSRELAWALRDKGIKPEAVVGLMVERSIEMITGMLAIIKAGGAYLPIDPAYPAERIEYILADSGAHVLITSGSLPGEDKKTGNWEGEKVFLDIETNPGLLHQGPSSTLTSTCRVSPTNLAYVIYTSGTTGRPRGVMVEHENVVRLAWNPGYIDFKEGDRLLLTGNIVFDITTFEIWGPLLNGLTLYLMDQEVILIKETLKKALASHCINILHLVPQVFDQLASEGVEVFSGLDWLLVGGDMVRPAYVNQVKEKFHDLQVLHMYGPTENTTFSTFYPVDQGFAVSIPIGKPINRSCAYVLGCGTQLQPPGAVGELVVGGIGVARGYLNQAQVTREKFIETPAVPGERLYKTGDLARWLPGGNLEFLGRIDQQVKIRGMRVELGEIENQLLEHNQVKEAAVVAVGKDDLNKALCAYIVPISPGVFENASAMEKKLKGYLSHLLPNHMVPTYYMEVKHIPLTANGKINRAALPQPEIRIDAKYTAPRDFIEKALVKIWMELLDLKATKIGIDDNFFQIGGHSLKATGLVSRIKKEFNINLPLGEIFKTPTIRELAEYIRSNEEGISSLQDNNLVLIRRDSEDSPHLFLIHDGTGDVEGYINFCNSLSIGINCWAIRSDRLENHTPWNITINELGKAYVEKIKKVQPFGNGPYLVAGWSVGGTIAFEVARLLEKENQEVAFLGLVDSIGPSRLEWIRELIVRGGWFWVEPGKFDVKSESRFVKFLLMDMKIEKDLKKMKIRKLEDFWPTLIDYLETTHYDLRTVKRQLERLGLHNILPNFRRLSLRECIYYVNIGRTFIRAVRNYIPRNKVKAPLFFFKAIQSIQLGKSEKRWQKYTSLPLNFYEISGDHATIFSKSKVAPVVQVFEKLMKEKILKQ